MKNFEEIIQERTEKYCPLGCDTVNYEILFMGHSRENSNLYKRELF
jgi:hypothetical protein